VTAISRGTATITVKAIDDGNGVILATCDVTIWDKADYYNYGFVPEATFLNSTTPVTITDKRVLVDWSNISQDSIEIDRRITITNMVEEIVFRGNPGTTYTGLDIISQGSADIVFQNFRYNNRRWNGTINGPALHFTGTGANGNPTIISIGTANAIIGHGNNHAVIGLRNLIICGNANLAIEHINSSPNGLGFDAIRLTDTLSVDMRGTTLTARGGDGAVGANGIYGANGDNGTSASTSMSVRNGKPGDDGRPGGTGGTGGSGISANRFNLLGSSIVIIKGGAGGRGGNGGNGGRGGNGNHWGGVTVREGGAGGIGGRGGSGGIGGTGGIAINVSAVNLVLSPSSSLTAESGIGGAGGTGGSGGDGGHGGRFTGAAASSGRGAVGGAGGNGGNGGTNGMLPTIPNASITQSQGGVGGLAGNGGFGGRDGASTGTGTGTQRANGNAGNAGSSGAVSNAVAIKIP
jgi:hypothetical protein